MPYAELMKIAGYLDEPESGGDKLKAPVNLRRFLHDNELIFDGIELTEQDKEWVERMLSALFWKERNSRNE
ncbi:hypothetical protein HMPREF1207_04255 [Paenibacillus sp. HGH0039]|nr:hypothetical protein HMPREF1207_04255 [Paenibacillus sp. HGH0039]